MGLRVVRCRSVVILVIVVTRMITDRIGRLSPITIIYDDANGGDGNNDCDDANFHVIAQ